MISVIKTQSAIQESFQNIETVNVTSEADFPVWASAIFIFPGRQTIKIPKI